RERGSTRRTRFSPGLSGGLAIAPRPWQESPVASRRKRQRALSRQGLPEVEDVASLWRSPAWAGRRTRRAGSDLPLNSFLRFWFPVLLYITLIFTISSVPNLRVPNFPGLSDKLVHACEYGVLGFLMVRALRGTTMATSLPASLVAVLFGLGVALADELYQAYVPGRQSDPADFAADAT